jgi:membrane protease YdiL (CAAX protease family)
MLSKFHGLMINPKNLLALAAVFGCVLLLALIPFDKVYRLFLSGEVSGHLKIVTVCLLVMIGSYQIAKRLHYLPEAGFREHRRYNYWMLGLPLLFPGILYLANIRNGCMLQPGSVLIPLVVISRGLMEEVLFRGVIQGFLTKNYPSVSSFRICLVSAGIFALAHFIALRVISFPFVLNQVIYAFFC